LASCAWPAPWFAMWWYVVACVVACEDALPPPLHPHTHSPSPRACCCAAATGLGALLACAAGSLVCVWWGQDWAAYTGATPVPCMAALDEAAVGRAPFVCRLLTPPCLPEGHDTEDGERVEFARSSAAAHTAMQPLTLCVAAAPAVAGAGGARSLLAPRLPVVAVLGAPCLAAAVLAEFRWVLARGHACLPLLRAADFP
jgi:hypothetical protein